jgi:hypothetical protein
MSLKDEEKTMASFGIGEKGKSRTLIFFRLSGSLLGASLGPGLGLLGGLGVLDKGSGPGNSGLAMPTKHKSEANNSVSSRS